MPPPSEPSPPLPPRFWAACVVALLVGAGMRLASDAVEVEPAEPTTDSLAMVAQLLEAPDRGRTPASYRGLGVWVDAFDFAPAYQQNGAEPALTPDVVDDFEELGVRTLYIQAARRDDRSGPGLLDETLLGQFLIRAHAAGIHVVAWYLPLFDSVEADLAKTMAMADFDVAGHRFDGIALDIEYTAGVADPVQRSAALVDLVERTHEALPDAALGAIVPPPVLTEVINPGFWPGFPWQEMSDEVAVWLPMAYWTTRSHDSGYRDAYRYSQESTRRLRDNVGGDPAVHIIGGIGDQTSPEDLVDFRDAIDRTDAIGGSIYDWNSMSKDLRQRLPAAVP